MAPDPADPLLILATWRGEAASAGEVEPDAMALATATSDGSPSVRFVLLRGIEGRVVRFFTSYGSQKADEIAANPRASGVFFWPRLYRQVRISGTVTRCASELSDLYWAQRPRGHQLSGAVSPQSHPIVSLDSLRRDRDALDSRLGDEPVPRPADWGGFDLAVSEVELWEGGEDRFHRRRILRWDGACWLETLVAP